RRSSVFAYPPLFRSFRDVATVSRQGSGAVLVAQDDLTWAAGAGLAADAGGDLLDLAAGFEESVDVLCQVDTVVDDRVFLRFGCQDRKSTRLNSSHVK